MSAPNQFNSKQNEIINKLENGLDNEVTKQDVACSGIVSLNFCPRCGSKNIKLWEAHDESVNGGIMIDFECKRCYRIFSLTLEQNDEDTWEYGPKMEA